MLRRNHPSALDRIIVQILQLLSHHGVIRDNLRMRALLPDLILVWFMRSTVIAKLIQKPFSILPGKLLQNFCGGELFISRSTADKSGAARIAWKWLSSTTQA